MQRRGRIVIFSALAALIGVALLFASIVWYLWKESMAAEEAYAGGLAAALGKRTEYVLLDARDLLARFDGLEAPRCSHEHLREMQQAAISRPYIRAIGYWQATERQCGVGFLRSEGLKPARADRVDDNGVIAWWPSAQTDVGGVQLFLMRYGDHDVAIAPRLLLDLGDRPNRQAVLWVEKLRLAASPWDASLPLPDSLPIGVQVDRGRGFVTSRFSHSNIMPIDVVAMEPISNFWSRHAQSMLLGATLGLLLVIAWINMVLRFSRHHLNLSTELRQAIVAGRIKVQYQPVIELRTGRCVGAEALARWERDNGESVSPDLFIPIAEQAGLVQDITLAVMRTTIHELRQLLGETPDLSVNLNLAPDDLKNDRVGVALTEGLKAAKLPPQTIKLEITERALVNTETSHALIRQFRSRGHQVAVDDFGTGYSSLSYLQSFELDVLKIDKSFVDAIGMEAATSQVIVHVIGMAKSLGLDIVAEGVETPAQVQWLLEHGVSHGQGFLFSKPLSVGAFIEYFRTNARHRKP